MSYNEIEKQIKQQILDEHREEFGRLYPEFAGPEPEEEHECCRWLNDLYSAFNDFAERVIRRESLHAAAADPAAAVDPTAAHLAQTDADVLTHLRDAADNIYRARDAVTNEWKSAAHRATVDIAAVHLTEYEAEVLAHLWDAASSVDQAIYCIENERQEGR